MKTRFAWVMVHLALWLGLTPYAAAQQERREQQLAQQPVTVRIDMLIQELLQQTGIPGVSVAVANSNQLLYANAAGYADVEYLVPATSETRFRTASIAKPMTAVAVLSLMESQLIDLDAPIQRYCPEFPEKEWPLTSRQLLGHLGGVRHYQHASESTTTQAFRDTQTALNVFRDDPLLHQPGTKYLYSTFGYNLLGAIAEGAAKEEFDKLLTRLVWSPAGMTQTVVDQQAAIVLGRARGYWRPTAEQLTAGEYPSSLTAGQLYNAPLHDTSMKVPGGGLLSTSTDLVRFAIALNTNRLLKPATRQLMWTSQRTSQGMSTEYGLGWMIGRHAGRKVVAHTGGQAGTSTVLVLFPETGTVVALMCNLQNVSLKPWALRIADLLLPDHAPQEHAEVVQRLQAAVSYEMEQKQLPALSIALVEGQRLLWSAGFGFQDEQSKVPATDQTVYRVGSVSKLFTDIAIMQLVEQGKLDLDAPITNLLPEFAPKSDDPVTITLRQLMSHRSGLVRESPVGNYFDPNEPTLAQTVASLNETSLVYPPGSKTKYSNAAIAVVGAVLERQLSVSHAEHVQAAILDPLHMSNSSFLVTDAVAEKLATGWMHTYDGRRFVAPQFLLGTGPAGNMYSNVLDLSKFLQCLFRHGATDTGRILRSESFQAMTTPVVDERGQPQDFGLGFHVQNFEGEQRIGHGGAVYGFSTQLEALPERQLGVAAVAALDGSNGVVRRLSDYALRLLKAKQDHLPLPDYRRTVAVDSQRAHEMVGLYKESNGTRTARLISYGEQLRLQLGTYVYQVRAAEDDGQLLTDDSLGFGIELSQESADHLKIGTVLYERTADELPPEIPERWQGLIGEYGWDHNTLYILEDQGQLVALIEWFYYYPLTEIDEHTFAFPDYGLYHGEKLYFERDAQQRAEAVVAADVRFERRQVGTEQGETFKIIPVAPVDQLRAAALAAEPPQENGDFLAADLVEPSSLDPTIKLDVRYATTNNFTGSQFYQQARAFMQRPAAEGVVRAHQRLQPLKLGLLIHDAYRPWHVTKMFWDATPTQFKDFVANPSNGSRHNRGCAIDLTLYDLATGQPVQMVAGYDEFSPRAFPLYPGGTARQRWYRELLRRTMESEGFSVYEFEWWHFDFRDWKKYRLQNATFEQLLP